MFYSSVLSLEKAREAILQVIQPIDSELVALPDAFERRVAEPIIAPINLPPFDNSAMDGYAVRAADVANASPSATVSLEIIGKVAAGDNFNGEVKTGTCVRVFTGSVLPKGADAVVMQEDTTLWDDDSVSVFDTVRPWENVRFCGEDVKKGSTVLQPGDALTATRVSVLSALGIETVPVYRNPIVGLLSTGSELREPGEPLKGADIYESNRAGLAGLVLRAGGIAKVYPLVPDDLQVTAAALTKAFEECDVVITSGGVSVGEFDFVKSAFEILGGTIDFWTVAVRPGKPFAFGQWNDKFLFGLPGNPVSALVTFCLFVWPALLRMQNAKSLTPPTQLAKTAQTLVNRGDRRHFMRVVIDEQGNVHSAGAQASHMLGAAARANGLVDVPADAEIEVGTIVKVLRWD